MCCITFIFERYLPHFCWLIICGLALALPFAYGWKLYSTPIDGRMFEFCIYLPVGVELFVGSPGPTKRHVFHHLVLLKSYCVSPGTKYPRCPLLCNRQRRCNDETIPAQCENLAVKPFILDLLMRRHKKVYMKGLYTNNFDDDVHDFIQAATKVL